MAELLRLFGIKVTGGNYATMRRHILRFDIDTSHWSGQGWLKGRTHNWSPKIPLKEIMVKDSTYASFSHLRSRLFEEKIFEKKCYKCGIIKWLNQSAPLQLEHINGNKFDNRIENLTILCCNCHALTETYAGKNKGKYGATERNRTFTDCST